MQIQPDFDFHQWLHVADPQKRTLEAALMLRRHLVSLTLFGSSDFLFLCHPLPLAPLYCSAAAVDYFALSKLDSDYWLGKAFQYEKVFLPGRTAVDSGIHGSTLVELLNISNFPVLMNSV